MFDTVRRVGLAVSVLHSEPGSNLGTCTGLCVTFLGKMFTHNSLERRPVCSLNCDQALH
jgi:hypothetical protein